MTMIVAKKGVNESLMVCWAAKTENIVGGCRNLVGVRSEN
jgi:hypothetical protein